VLTSLFLSACHSCFQHNLRSCVTAMQETSRAIFKEQSLMSVEPRVASVKEVFRLQDQPELDSAEKKYLPQKKA
jgi:phosphoenolpyruvate phosphomutase